MSHKGRQPVTRMAILAVLEAHPLEGMSTEHVAEITGLRLGSVRDGFWKLRALGLVSWLTRGREVIHFATPEACAEFAKVNPTYGYRAVLQSPVGRESRIPAILSALANAPAIGMSTQEVSEGAKISVTNASKLLQSMERNGEVWRYGPHYHMRWYVSQAAKEIGAKLIDQHVAAKRASMDAGRRRGASVVAKAGPSTIWTKQETTGRIVKAPKPPKPPKPEKVARLPKATEPKASPQPVVIIGIPEEKVQRRPTPRGRFEPAPGHVGEFSSLGVGRYVE